MTQRTTEEEIPTMLRLSDGTDIPHEVGAEAYNYYDMCPATITRTATRSEPDTSGRLPGGRAWWVDTTAGCLDGSRMCSLAFAARKGWT